MHRIAFAYKMKAYIATINGEIQREGFTALKSMCNAVDVSYASAARGKRKWFKDKKFTEIFEITIWRTKRNNIENLQQ